MHVLNTESHPDNAASREKLEVATSATRVRQMPPGQERTAARLANCDAQLLSPLVSQPFSMLSTSSCRAQPKSAIRQRSSIMASPRLMTRLLMHSNRACRLGSGWHAGLQHKALRKLHRWDPGRQLACVSQLCSFRAVLVPRLSCCEGRPAAMPAAHTTSTSPGSSADRPSPCLKSIPDVENPKQTLKPVHMATLYHSCGGTGRSARRVPAFDLAGACRSDFHACC